ncbi:MAG: hypothetical protein HZA15_00880 [Nitrospirae bacterium]|nr:hypothetical protein [Nitrospirota bacterium]
MNVSQEAEKELVSLGRSEALRDDMDKLKSTWQSPFIRNGAIDTDLYIEFVQEFNEFINHQPKPFRPMIEKDMRL